MLRTFHTFGRIAFGVIALTLAVQNSSGTEPLFSPGQPSLLKRAVSLQAANGTTVNLTRGEYVRVCGSNGNELEIRSLLGNGKIPVDSLYTVQELRERAESWLESLEKPNPDPEAITFALFSHSGDPRTLITLMTEMQRYYYHAEIEFHARINEQLKQPSFDPNDFTPSENVSRDEKPSSEFQNAYLSGLTRHSSPALESFLERSKSSKREVAEALIIQFISDENAIVRKTFLKEAISQAAILPDSATNDPLFEAMTAIYCLEDVATDIAYIRNRYMPSSDFEEQLQVGLNAIRIARSKDHFDGTLLEIDLAMEYCLLQSLIRKRQSEKARELAQELYRKVVMRLKTYPFQPGVFAIAGNIEEMFTPTELVTFRKENRYLYSMRYNNLTATLDRIRKPGNSFPASIVWGNYLCVPTLPGSLPQELAVERFLTNSSFDTTLLPRLQSAIAFHPVGADIFDGPRHFTFEMQNENLNELQKYSGAKEYLVWLFANSRTDASKMRLDKRNQQLIEASRNYQVQFTTDR